MMALACLPSHTPVQQLLRGENAGGACWKRSKSIILRCRKLGDSREKLPSSVKSNVLLKRRHCSCNVGAAFAVLNETGVSLEKNDSASSAGVVLVIGASGGVGQLVVASLLDRGYAVRAVLRDKAKAVSTIFRGADDRLQICVADLRMPHTITPDIFEGVSHIVCSCGTTAFPSSRWKDNNNPEQADWVAMKNLLAVVPRDGGLLKRFVMVSSVGVTRQGQLPFSILNLFGVLKFKKMGEDHLRASGVPYTIIRAGRLTDGPYTSYDLNTLLKGTAGSRRQVVVEQGDRFMGETSRLVVAEACIQALAMPCTEGQVFEVGSVEGEGPAKDAAKWESLFLGATRA